MDAAGKADAAEIVAREVDDHEILGAILFAAGECGAERGVFLGSASSADGSFDGARFHVARGVDSQEALGRRAGDIDVIEMQIRRMRCGIELAQRLVIGQRRDVGLYAELIGEADLVAFAGGDARLAFGDETEIFIAFRCQREFERVRRAKMADGGQSFNRRDTPFEFLIWLATRHDPQRVLGVIDGKEAIHSQQARIGKRRAMLGWPQSALSRSQGSRHSRR